MREKRSIAKAENPNSVAIKGTAIVRKPGDTTRTHHRTTFGETKLYVKKHQHNNKRAHIVPYKKGTAVSSNNGIGAKRPAYLDNKCLVISHVNIETGIPQLQNYVNERAGRNVKFLHEPINMAKEYSKWRTIAIELSDNDYELLSKPEFWDSNILLRDFKGRRWWRNPASNLTVDERRNSFRQHWTSA